MLELKADGLEESFEAIERQDDEVREARDGGFYLRLGDAAEPMQAKARCTRRNKKPWG